jgi:pyruvate/2-oxoglutarate dehydrogenase complex dihydrolipoamide dehydrogenase (E3) component
MSVITAAEQFDLVILGSGEAGKYLAWTFGKQGKRVAMIERRYVGGSCPNIACLPSKNVIHSAKVASYFARAPEFGNKLSGFQIDMSIVRERKRKMVEELVDIHEKNFGASKVELIHGSGRFTAAKTIEVSLNEGGTRTLSGEHVVICTGTTARLGTIPGLQDSAPMTHVETLELDVVPAHLLILGGGYIGLEFAQAMRRFGSEVTVFEHNDRLLPREDEDVSDALRQLMEDEGICVVTGARVTGVQGRSGDKIIVDCVKNGWECSTEGSHLLVAAGRTPNTNDIGLETAGVDLGSDGYVLVNERLETSVLGVWAVGECAGSPQFTHAAYDDFRIVRDNMMGRNRVSTGRQMPYCLFTDPELARIGLSEREAKDRGISYRLFTMPMSSDLRTRTLSETRGFMKALVEAESDTILGFTVFGVGAGEVMSCLQIAMLAGLPYTALRDAVLAHPTLTEGLVTLFSSAPLMASPSSTLHGNGIAAN